MLFSPLLKDEYNSKEMHIQNIPVLYQYTFGFVITRWFNSGFTEIRGSFLSGIYRTKLWPITTRWAQIQWTVSYSAHQLQVEQLLKQSTARKLMLMGTAIHIIEGSTEQPLDTEGPCLWVSRNTNSKHDCFL